MAGMVALCTALYLFTQDQRDQAWYGAALAGYLFCINMSLYLIVPELRGPEKTAVAIEEVGDSDSKRLLAETEENPTPEKKKKEKKGDLESAAPEQKKEKKEKKKEKTALSTTT
jgi:hypothetical protein